MACGRASAWHEAAGFAAALGGLGYLLLPGLAAPPLQDAALMLAAGVAWGVYSLLGRGMADPTQAIAGNFLRAVPFAAVLCLDLLAGHRRRSVRRPLRRALRRGDLGPGLRAVVRRPAGTEGDIRRHDPALRTRARGAGRRRAAGRASQLAVAARVGGDPRRHRAYDKQEGLKKSCSKLAERLRNVKVSASAAMTRKVRELRAEGVKIVGLSSGEPDFPTPPHAIEAAIGRRLPARPNIRRRTA